MDFSQLSIEKEMSRGGENITSGKRKALLYENDCYSTNLNYNGYHILLGDRRELPFRCLFEITSLNIATSKMRFYYSSDKIGRESQNFVHNVQKRSGIPRFSRFDASAFKEHE